MENLIFVGVGGFLGASARYLLSSWLNHHFITSYGSDFPAATLLVNFSGSLLLALFVAWAGRRVDLSPNLRLLVATGFFGAYTTFSTFANETVALVQRGAWLAAAANLIGTNALCILGVFMGLALASRL